MVGGLGGWWACLLANTAISSDCIVSKVNKLWLCAQGRWSVGMARGWAGKHLRVKASREIGGPGASPGKLLVPRPLDCLKVILRMFQLTETMFHWDFFGFFYHISCQSDHSFSRKGHFCSPFPLLAKGRRGACPRAPLSSVPVCAYQSTEKWLYFQFFLTGLEYGYNPLRS